MQASFGWTLLSRDALRRAEKQLRDAAEGVRDEVGGFRAMFSTNGGETWICSHEKWGFPVDPSVYGYGQAVELSDGSIWAAYIHTGGHATKDAKTGALWSIRLRVRRDPDGIELLPAPGA